MTGYVEAGILTSAAFSMPSFSEGEQIYSLCPPPSFWGIIYGEMLYFSQKCQGFTEFAQHNMTKLDTVHTAIKRHNLGCGRKYRTLPIRQTYSPRHRHFLYNPEDPERS